MILRDTFGVRILLVAVYDACHITTKNQDSTFLSLSPRNYILRRQQSLLQICSIKMADGWQKHRRTEYLYLAGQPPAASQFVPGKQSIDSRSRSWLVPQGCDNHSRHYYDTGARSSG